MNPSLLAWKGFWWNVIEERALIVRINRSQKQRRCWEEKKWWRGCMKCHIMLPKQHDIHSGKKTLFRPRVLHWSWPRYHSPVSLITALGAFEGIIWSSLTGQVSQDGCPLDMFASWVVTNCHFIMSLWDKSFWEPSQTFMWALWKC